MPDAANATPDRCPRCGGGFHCGVNDAAPCPCTGARLTEPLRAALRQRWSTCLCLRCLQALMDGAPVDLPPDGPRIDTDLALH